MNSRVVTAFGVMFVLAAVTGCPGPEPQGGTHANTGGSASDNDGGGGRARVGSGGRDDGGVSGTGGAKGTGAANGTGGSSGAGAGGRAETGGTGNESGGADSGIPPGGCHPGDKQCDGDTPQTCGADREWASGTPCSGSNPICNGGTCGPFRIVGGLEALGKRPTTTSRTRLRDDGFHGSARSCRGDICISGGLTP